MRERAGRCKKGHSGPYTPPPWDYHVPESATHYTMRVHPDPACLIGCLHEQSAIFTCQQNIVEILPRAIKTFIHPDTYIYTIHYKRILANYLTNTYDTRAL